MTYTVDQWHDTITPIPAVGKDKIFMEVQKWIARSSVKEEPVK
jgi:hypothetical protein